MQSFSKRSSSVRRVLALPAVLFALLAAPRTSFARADEPLLEPGPFLVGFKTSWAYDAGRTYRTAADDGKTYGAGKSPRPVLVLLWYPARTEQIEPAPARMSHGDYFSISGDESAPHALADALAAYARDVFVQETFEKAETALDDEQRAELERLLAKKTPCVRDAPAAESRFPLVLYHSGAGSSFEDNAALCEFLASHGFVVAGSAFLKADGSGFGIDADRGSADDAQLLVRFSHALPFVDPRAVALVGHSAGAQAFFKFAATPGCVADAVVLLDTTQDYYALGLPLHESLVREVVAGKANVRQPLLAAAGPDAIFELFDSVTAADRIELTVPELGHDEYISQGHQRLERMTRQHAAGTLPASEASAVAGAAKVHANYRVLCTVILEFLDATLRHDRAALDARLAADAARGWRFDEPCTTRVPPGADGPEPWDAKSDAPPSPRQFARVVKADGESAPAILARFRAANPKSPLFSSSMLGGSMLFQLVDSGHGEDARHLLTEYRAIPLDVLSVFDFLSDISAMQGKTEPARRLLRIACDLDPDDGVRAKKLETLDASAGR